MFWILVFSCPKMTLISKFTRITLKTYIQNAWLEKLLRGVVFFKMLIFSNKDLLENWIILQDIIICGGGPDAKPATVKFQNLLIDFVDITNLIIQEASFQIWNHCETPHPFTRIKNCKNYSEIQSSLISIPSQHNEQAKWLGRFSTSESSWVWKWSSDARSDESDILVQPWEVIDGIKRQLSWHLSSRQE